MWRNFHKNELKEEINNFSNFRIKIWNIYPVDGGFHISLLIEQPVELKQVLFLGTDVKKKIKLFCFTFLKYLD